MPVVLPHVSSGNTPLFPYPPWFSWGIFLSFASSVCAVSRHATEARWRNAHGVSATFHAEYRNFREKNRQNSCIVVSFFSFAPSFSRPSPGFPSKGPTKAGRDTPTGRHGSQRSRHHSSQFLSRHSKTLLTEIQQDAGKKIGKNLWESGGCCFISQPCLSPNPDARKGGL